MHLWAYAEVLPEEPRRGDAECGPQVESGTGKWTH